MTNFVFHILMTNFVIHSLVTAPIQLIVSFLSRRDALPLLIDGRLHVDDVDGLFGSRVKVQKRDCVYSIVAHVCRACSLPLTPLRTRPPF